MGTTSPKDIIIHSVKEDDALTLSKYIHIMKPNEYINEPQTFTALHICCCFGSRKCSELLMNEGWDVNCKEKQNGNSSLLLAIKYGHFDIVKLIFKNKFKVNCNSVNDLGLNALDMAIIYQQVNVGMYLINEKGFKINKNIMQYKTIMKDNDVFISKVFDTFYNEIVRGKQQLTSITNESTLNDKSILLEEIKL